MAVLPDFIEEGWLSMEYCAERLLAAWPGPMRAERVCPHYRRIATRLPGLATKREAVNADRALNRYWRYPNYLKKIRNQFDCFHVVDHSYAHLVHILPAERTGVFCHDLDAFRSVLEPAAVRRSRLFRRMTGYLLSGLRKAALVFVNSQQTREQLLQFSIVEAARIIHAPLGVAEEFTPNSDTPQPIWLDNLAGRPWILHVGSCVPRKRIDVLLDVFAMTKQSVPELQLVKVSGEFAPAQREQIERLKLATSIMHVNGLSRSELAAVYRAAPLVLVPSESEGFGLPALEAVACGAKVLASDLPSLREAAGSAARYCPVADRTAWAAVVAEAFHHPEIWPGREIREAQAKRFSWHEHAATVANAYDVLMKKAS